MQTKPKHKETDAWCMARFSPCGQETDQVYSIQLPGPARYINALRYTAAGLFNLY